MYFVALEKLSSATSPPCFWNCGTAAGEVLKTRQGALPAVIAAPMTSSEVLPAGISCAVTFSLGCAAFHEATIALPQASSSVLFESQILIGPRAEAASPLPPPPPPQALRRPTPTARPAAVTVRRGRFMIAPIGCRVVRGRRHCSPAPRVALGAARGRRAGRQHRRGSGRSRRAGAPRQRRPSPSGRTGRWSVPAGGGGSARCRRNP